MLFVYLVYPACFIKEENGYSVIFPDLNTATCGATLKEYTWMAVDCLAGYLYALQRDGKNAPIPTPFNQINTAEILANLLDKEEDFSRYETFVNLITVDVEEYAKRHFERASKKLYRFLILLL